MCHSPHRAIVLLHKWIILIPHIARQYRTHLAAHIFVHFLMEEEFLQIAGIPIANVRSEYAYAPQLVIFLLLLPIDRFALQLPDG